MTTTTTTTTDPTDEQDGPESRLPEPPYLRSELLTIAGGMNKAIRKGSIPEKSIGLMQLRPGSWSAAPTTPSTRPAISARQGRPRSASPPSHPGGTLPITDAERVALELVDAVLTPNPSGERVPDELFTRAADHYDEQDLWTLTVVIGQICFFIPVALIAKPIPGRAPGKNYSQPSAREESA